MSWLDALILGITQGLTEFLPISSSGHLILVPWLLNISYLEDHPDFNKTFDVALHAGTLVAVFVYFRAEVVDLTRSFFSALKKRRVDTESERRAWLIALATVPAVIAGGVGESFIQDKLGEPWQIAILLVVFGLLLGAADRLPQRFDMTGLTWRSALGVGLAQALALAPGTSRSGITMTAGRFFGLDRDAAARFSFLLLAPVVFGATVYKGLEVVHQGLPAGSGGPLVVGVVSAAASGFAAIFFLLRYLRTHSYDIFVVYRLITAFVVVLLIATGARGATF